ncbi:MAG: DUF3592 domain-containing protein [Ktedonobacteraceae bacterium]
MPETTTELVRDHRSSLVMALILSGIPIVSAAVIFVNNQLEVDRGEASRNFASTPGKVIYTHESRGGRYDSTTLRYQYSVDGKSFDATRVRFPDWTKSSDIYRMPQGTDLNVYYDPQNPSSSCLVRGVDTGLVGWTNTGGIAFIIIGLVLGPWCYYYCRKNGVGVRRA